MKKYLIFAGLFILTMTTSSYAMGGAPAPEDNRRITVQANPVGSDRVSELDKARSDMKMEKAELQKLEKSLWMLDVKEADARKKGDTTKLLQLKEQEQDTIEKARLIQGSIARRLEKYPELKVSEAIEKNGASKPMENPEVAPHFLPVPKTSVVAPQSQTTAVQPKSASGIINYIVQQGDTLFSVSRKYYGTPVHYKDIAHLNNILPIEGLKVGMTLKIDLRLKNTVAPKPAATPNL